MCKVQLNQAVPEEPGSDGYLLDLDYFLSQPQSISPKQAIEWVDRAHGQVEEIFEGCITDRLREIFQEVE